MQSGSRDSDKYIENFERNDAPDGGIRFGNIGRFDGVGAEKFVRLGKGVAPRIGRSDDLALLRSALGGETPDDIARALGGCAAEVTIRLVQLRTGPLGRVRPAAHGEKARVFDDVPLKPSATPVPEMQQPILPLAAIVLGDVLQRLGDRLYLAGQETQLPEVVQLAREKGVRIRYPGIDPVARAWCGGPSRRETRRGRSARPWEWPR